MDEKVLKNLILDTKKTALDNGYIVTLSTSGRSMFPILTSSNTIEIVKCANKDLRCGDIIVFSPKNSNILIAHRLIHKIKNEKSYTFITKGDSHIYCDNNPVDRDAIIGKITRIKKAKLNLSLEHSIGKTINNILFFYQ